MVTGTRACREWSTVYQLKYFSCLSGCHILAQKNVLLHWVIFPCSKDTNFTGRENSCKHQHDLLGAESIFSKQAILNPASGDRLFSYPWLPSSRDFEIITKAAWQGLLKLEWFSFRLLFPAVLHKTSLSRFYGIKKVGLPIGSSNCKVRHSDSSCQAKSQSRELPLCSTDHLCSQHQWPPGLQLWLCHFYYHH